MLFSRFFAAAALVATVVAQSKIIQFTTLPSNVEVGKPVPIKWTGGDGSPVTITLKKGTPKDLKTVTVLTGKFPPALTQHQDSHSPISQLGTRP